MKWKRTGVFWLTALAFLCCASLLLRGSHDSGTTAEADTVKIQQLDRVLDTSPSPQAQFVSQFGQDKWVSGASMCMHLHACMHSTCLRKHATCAFLSPCVE